MVHLGLRMIMRRSVVMRVAVSMPVLAAVVMMVVPLGERTFAAISATLRLERALDVMHVRAKTDHHFFQHVIGLNVDRVACDLGGSMPVADVPGDARQHDRVLRVNLKQRLGRGDDPDEPAALDIDRVAMPEVGRLG